MAVWTHIGGIIRLDNLPMIPYDGGALMGKALQLTEEQAIEWLSANAPIGSEGGLTFYAKRTQTVEENSTGLVWGSVSFAGDLRDYDDTEEVKQWLINAAAMLLGKLTVIRNAAVTIEVEGGPHVYAVWVIDKWTFFDV